MDWHLALTRYGNRASTGLDLNQAIVDMFLVRAVERLKREYEFVGIVSYLFVIVTSNPFAINSKVSSILCPNFRSSVKYENPFQEVSGRLSYHFVRTQSSLI